MEQLYHKFSYSKNILFVAYEQRNATWIPPKKNKALSRTLERQERNPHDSVTYFETSSIILQKHDIKFRWNLYIYEAASHSSWQVHRHRDILCSTSFSFYHQPNGELNWRLSKNCHFAVCLAQTWGGLQECVSFIWPSFPPTTVLLLSEWRLCRMIK